MSTNLNQILSQIDHKTNHLVHGYIRAIEQILKQDNSAIIIPSLVIYTCLIYYWLNEHFDIINESVVIQTSNKMKLISGKGSSNKWNNSNFGNILIPSIGDDIYKWKLKLTRFGLSAADDSSLIQLLFGISNGDNITEAFVHDEDDIFYGIILTMEKYLEKLIHQVAIMKLLIMELYANQEIF